MPDWLVETELKINDKASKALASFIGEVERADKALTIFNATMGGTLKLLQDFGIVSKEAQATFKGISKEVLTFEERLQKMGAATSKANTSFDKMKKSGEELGIAMREASLDIEKASVAMEKMNKFQGGGGSGGGGSHGGGSHGGHGKSWIQKAGHMIGHAMSPQHLFDHALTAMIGMDIMHEGMEPGLEWQTYNQRMEFLLPGQKHAAERAAMRKSALDTSTSMLGTTPAKNMESLLEATTVTNSPEHAIEGLRTIKMFEQGMAIATQAVPSLKDQDYSQVLLKGIEMFGKNKPSDLKHHANMLFKSIVGDGGIIKPQAWNQAMQFSRAAKYGKDDEFMYQVMPFIMQETASSSGLGGSKTGTLVKNLDNSFFNGVVKKEVKQHLMDIGIYGKDGKVIEEDKFIKNPFEWATGKDSKFRKILMKEGHTDEAHFEKMDAQQKRVVISSVMKGTNALTNDLMTQFFELEKPMRGHIDRTKNVVDLEQAYQQSLGMTQIKFEQLNARFATLLTNLGRSDIVMKPLNKALDVMISLIGGLNAIVLGLDKNMPKTLQAINSVFGDGGGIDKMMNSLGFAGHALEKFTGILDSMVAFIVNHSFGFLAGAATGAAVGSVGGVPGMIAGAGIGGVVGAFGDRAGHRTYDATSKFLGKNVLVPPPPPPGTEWADMRKWDPTQMPKMEVPPPAVPQPGGFHPLARLPKKTIDPNKTGAMLAPQVNVTINGNVGVKNIGNEIAMAVSKGMAQAHHMFSATTGLADGNMSTPELAVS